MAGDGVEEDRSESRKGGQGGYDGCSFEWDDESHLYFHSSSGFYHDPNAGWYYSSRDGLYYKFENGSYVPWEYDKQEESEPLQHVGTNSGEPSPDQPCSTQCFTIDGAENPQPPSEWLEETLINFYLTGYSNEEVHAGCPTTTLKENGEESNDVGKLLIDELSSKELSGSQHRCKFDDVEEGQYIPEDVGEAPETSDRFFGEDASWDEEKWQAQYGQVILSVDEGLPAFPVVDLWDWSMVKETGKKKYQVAKLVGRLVRRSMTLHPSMPAGGSLLKTTAIREVHLDLVRVASGKVYRLRSPSAGYLSSLSEYDSANPTKYWGFPELIINSSSILSSSLGESNLTKTSDSIFNCEGSSSSSHQLASAFGKNNQIGYRDRAAERRTLYGGFGIGPGQKKFDNGDIDEEAIFSESSHEVEAMSEAINKSFGAGSYARRIMENMGWKEGEALGRTNKGLLEPIQAVGNKGNVGLGWKMEREP